MHLGVNGHAQLAGIINEDVESIVVEEPVSMMKEKSSNSATGKISIGLTSMVMMCMMMFWS